MQAALNEITTGIETADVIAAAAGGRLSQLERMVWEYSREMISGISDYSAAALGAGETWAAYDLDSGYLLRGYAPAFRRIRRVRAARRKS